MNDTKLQEKIERIELHWNEAVIENARMESALLAIRDYISLNGHSMDHKTYNWMQWVKKTTEAGLRKYDSNELNTNEFSDYFKHYGIEDAEWKALPTKFFRLFAFMAGQLEAAKQQCAKHDSELGKIIDERDSAEGYADRMASGILNAPINWGNHEATWKEAIESLKVIQGLRQRLAKLHQFQHDGEWQVEPVGSQSVIGWSIEEIKALRKIAAIRKDALIKIRTIIGHLTDWPGNAGQAKRTILAMIESAIEGPQGIEKGPGNDSN